MLIFDSGVLTSTYSSMLPANNFGVRVPDTFSCGLPILRFFGFGGNDGGLPTQQYTMNVVYIVMKILIYINI